MTNNEELNYCTSCNDNKLNHCDTCNKEKCSCKNKNSILSRVLIGMFISISFIIVLMLLFSNNKQILGYNFISDNFYKADSKNSQKSKSNTSNTSNTDIIRVLSDVQLFPCTIL